MLYVILHRRGHFGVEARLRVADLPASDRRRGDGRRAVLASARFIGGWFDRVLRPPAAGVVALVGGGMAVYFACCLLGGTSTARN